MMQFLYGVVSVLAAELIIVSACWATKRYVAKCERAKQEIELARIRAASEAEMAKLKAAEEERERKNEAARLRYAENPQVPLRDKARRIIRSLITKEAELLGEYDISSADILIGIREQFDPSMTFLNYGDVWELDHDKPLASFDLTDPLQFSSAISPLNLQPLFKGENRQKSDTDLRAFTAAG